MNYHIKNIKLYKQTYTIHTNPHINVEAPPGAAGPDDFLSRLQLWPPWLTKAPLGAGGPQNPLSSLQL